MNTEFFKRLPHKLPTTIGSLGVAAVLWLDYNLDGIRKEQAELTEVNARLIRIEAIHRDYVQR